MTDTQHDDLALERRFAAGDELVLHELYRRFSGPMYAAAYNVLGSRDLAADAVQQAFVQAWRAADRFDASREIQPWLYAITRRAAVDIYRRRRKIVSEVPFDESWSSAAELRDAGISLDATWQVWQVREALERLPPDERQVLQLAYYQGMTQSEIAAALSIALGTVKSRTFRAQRHLASRLAHLRDG
ncbi:RNA polymerase sigma factor [Micromonospora auratinigra]|uniref:RNA polymerase, sigma-24 subunit, RpoE n=1 Tax=Micromonospora auratinigra TaxID=261654 RepID=A0A1A8Z4C6_9ACTN|nr:sigma-70 family RNA polymerase sigma factor [Micromonospora auratinigra]SBT38711.1 RNA polymerase, sigma-24 subunit, RpoE [Micromonospora auratinigra]